MSFSIKKNKVLLLIICISIPLIAGGLAGIATIDSVNSWYKNLNKPGFNPPDYLFGPVWTALYLLMGISLFMVLKESDEKNRKKLIAVFSLQLILNFLWSFLFFYFRNIALAFVEIIALWIFIIVMIKEFYKVNAIAAWLQIPYLLWVSFASILNGSIWWIN